MDEMKLPQDPVMLLSAINMKLRDRYRTLDALCEDMGMSREGLEEKLLQAGYAYDPQDNRFA